MQAKPSYTAVVEPSRWELQSGGGYLALFGIPFLAGRSLRAADSPGQSPWRGKIIVGGGGKARLPDGRPLPRIAQMLLNQGGNSGLMVRSDKRTLVFGQGLGSEELDYLQVLIKKALAG